MDKNFGVQKRDIIPFIDNIMTHYSISKMKKMKFVFPAIMASVIQLKDLASSEISNVYSGL